MTTTPTKAKEESLLPPKVMTALTMVASGTSFYDAAECVGMSGRALRNGESTEMQMNLLN